MPSSQRISWKSSCAAAPGGRGQRIPVHQSHQRDDHRNHPLNLTNRVANIVLAGGRYAMLERREANERLALLPTTVVGSHGKSGLVA